MKKIIGFLVMLCLLLISCSTSEPSVSRINADTRTDLSGYWNDTDVRIVCEALINDCINSPRVSQAIAAKGSKLPVVLVGSFKNESSEHIDTSIISSTMEITIFNSGKMDFVSGGSTRTEIRDERQDQQSNASESTAARLANETGADFLLTGALRAIVDKAGNQTVRTYFVSAEMTNIETNSRMWMAQNNEIKKVIVQPKHKL
jgi:uncharacterized protein (TIGR02722 family)